MVNLMQKMCQDKQLLFITLLITVFCVFMAGCTQPRQAIKLPNIIFITIDTCRADFIGCYGFANDITPHIDEAAREGVLFENVLTVVPITLPSHSSIFTGLYPLRHKVRDNGSYRLSDKFMTLAEILQQHGYRCAASVGAFVMERRFGLIQGFDDYYDQFTTNDADGGSRGQSWMGFKVKQFERPAAKVNSDAIEWLKKNHSQPFFLWLHYFDPHASYSPPEPYKSRFKNNPYAGEINYVDAMIGNLYAYLRANQLWENTLLVITSDHGELLGEHGVMGHGQNLFQPALKIPLILRWPGYVPGGKRIKLQCSTIDIMPTVLELLNIRLDQSIDGTSLVKYFKGKKSPRTIFAETLYPERLYDKKGEGFFGVMEDNWKVIIHRTRNEAQIYNHKTDPQEAKPLSLDNLKDLKPKEMKVINDRLQLLQEYRKASNKAESDKIETDQETIDALKALGYIK